jgi:dihydroxyacetone kinase-like predicted kinase
MITVIREMAHRVATELPRMGKSRLDHDASDEEQDTLIADVLTSALDAAETSVKKSPELLPMLREHGVVDAGAYGVTLLVAGLIAGLRGDEPSESHVPHYAAARPHDSHHEESLYRYCTNFIVSGQGMEGLSFVPELEALGDSVLVVGDARTLRVHVHTDEPDRAVAVFDAAGAVERLDVADMHEQQDQRIARLASQNGSGRAQTVRCGVVAVAVGTGMR